MKKTIISERFAVNSKGQELRWALYSVPGEKKPYELVEPGRYPRRFKTLESAEKAFNPK